MRVEYEGIHPVCFGCGVYGHRKETCLTAAPEEGDKEGGGNQILGVNSAHGESHVHLGKEENLVQDLRR